jgi:hypothetical protein
MGAEIIPHELDRYHERVRSGYEISNRINQRSTVLTFSSEFSRLQAGM